MSQFLVPSFAHFVTMLSLCKLLPRFNKVTFHNIRQYDFPLEIPNNFPRVGEFDSNFVPQGEKLGGKMSKAVGIPNSPPGDTTDRCIRVKNKDQSTTTG